MVSWKCRACLSFFLYFIESNSFFYHRINNKAGPHNVVFDEDAVPEGVDFEKISMIDGEQLGEEGETFTRTFDTLGSYEYYCEPHRGAGMNGVVTVV
jgi:plastocyanin